MANPFSNLKKTTSSDLPDYASAVKFGNTTTTNAFSSNTKPTSSVPSFPSTGFQSQFPELKPPSGSSGEGSNLFGASTTQASFTKSKNMFGGSVKSTSTFGQSSKLFSGTTQPITPPNLFGPPKTDNVSTTANPNLFGPPRSENVSTTANLFGSSITEKAPTAASSNLFGPPTTENVSTTSNSDLFGPPKSENVVTTSSPNLFTQVVKDDHSKPPMFGTIGFSQEPVQPVFGGSVKTKESSFEAKKHTAPIIDMFAPVTSDEIKSDVSKTDTSLFTKPNVTSSVPISSQSLFGGSPTLRKPTSKRTETYSTFSKAAESSSKSNPFSGSFSTIPSTSSDTKEKSFKLNPFATDFVPKTPNPFANLPDSSKSDSAREAQLLFSGSTADSIIQNLLKATPTPVPVPTENIPKPKPQEKKQLVALNIDSHYLDKSILKDHFQKFGNVRTVYVNKKTKQASITFYDPLSAANAKEKGKMLHPKVPEMVLLYGVGPSKKSSSEDNTKEVGDQIKKKAVNYFRQVSQEGASEISPRLPFKSKSKVSPSEKSKVPPKPAPPPGRAITDYSNLFDDDVGDRPRRERGRDRASERPYDERDSERHFIDRDHRGKSSWDRHEPSTQSTFDRSPRSLIKHKDNYRERSRSDKSPLSLVKHKHDHEKPRLNRSPLSLFKNKEERTRAKSDPIKERDDKQMPETSTRSYSPRARNLKIKNQSSESTRDDSSRSYTKYKTTSLEEMIKSEGISKVDTAILVDDEKEFNINSQANNNNDKFNVLKVRDKILRSKQEKDYDIKTASYLSATCPDMCPEKERYMRKVQCDFSSLEMTNKDFDHRLMVKKFSRSSADKDEPLPHELRPGPVLTMTMNYLICNIVERCDDPSMESDLWYNFLWNRTRGLRNDISQQHLVDENAVYVLERCTRFHIVCAERFCDVPPDVFDPKMNTEHLSKSLQTLKELYKDMGEKGVYFDTESEFRCYEMLLDVNDSNIMLKYVQFRDIVKTSDAVQFAIKVLKAIQSRDYIKFFRLVKRATFLQSCIMHRYFNLVRVQALAIMLKTYAGANKQSIPIEKVVEFLGFEDNEDAARSLKHYNIETKDGGVIMNKVKANLYPEEKPPITKPVNLIESKCIATIGQEINNGPLPPNPLDTYKPHDSFTKDGYLKSSAKNASDQSGNQNTEIISAEPVAKPQEPTQTVPLVKEPSKNLFRNEPIAPVFEAHSKNVFTNEPITPVFESFTKKQPVPNEPSFSNVFAQATHSKTPNVFQTSSVFDKPTPSVFDKPSKHTPLVPNYENNLKEVCNNILNEVIAEEAEYIARDVLENTPLEELLDKSIYDFIAIQIKKRHFQAWRDYVQYKKQVHNMEHEIKNLIKAEVLDKWKNKVVAIKKANEFRERRSKKVIAKYFGTWQMHAQNSRDLKNKAINIHNKYLAKNVIRKWKKYVISVRKIRENALIVERNIMRNVLVQWKEFSQIKQSERSAIQYYENKLLKSTLKKWKIWVTGRKKLSWQDEDEFLPTGSHLDVMSQNKSLQWGYKRKAEEDLTAIEVDRLEKKLSAMCSDFNLRRSKYTADPFPLHQLFTDKIDKHFSKSRNILALTFKVLIYFNRCGDKSKDYMLKDWLRSKLSIEDEPDLDEPIDFNFTVNSQMSGTTYMLIFKECNTPADIQTNLTGTNLIISVFHTQEGGNLKFNQINFTISNSIISNYISQERYADNDCIHINYNDLYSPGINEDLISHIIQYWDGRADHLCLHSNDLYTWVSSFISNHVLVPIYKQQHSRIDFKYSPMNPNSFVAFYNEALDFLIKVLNDSDISRLNWPPSEAKEIKGVPDMVWGAEEINQISYQLESIKLPKFVIDEYKTWSDIKVFLDQFLDEILGEGMEGLELSTEAYKLFSIARNSYIEYHKLFDEEDPPIHHYLAVPWLEIVNACISYKLSGLSTTRICYKANYVEYFDKPNSWRDACNFNDPMFYHYPSDRENVAQSIKRTAEVEASPFNEIKKRKSILRKEIQDENSKALEYEKLMQQKLQEGEAELRALMAAMNMPYLEKDC